MAKSRKNKRGAKTNRHHQHLLFQRTHWDKNGYALAIRNKFIYTMRIDRHDYIHDNLHDIPLPPEDDLINIYQAMQSVDISKMSAFKACLWLADISEFEPFKACMRYQACLIFNANKLQ